jgi:hypothetical protein
MHLPEIQHQLPCSSSTLFNHRTGLSVSAVLVYLLLFKSDVDEVLLSSTSNDELSHLKKNLQSTMRHDLRILYKSGGITNGVFLTPISV